MGSSPGSPNHPWRPGSTSYPVVRQVLDPLASKQELLKLYDQVAESSYDLSLKDLVDPSHSIYDESATGTCENILLDSKESNSLGDRGNQPIGKKKSKGGVFRRKFPSSLLPSSLKFRRRHVKATPSNASIAEVAQGPAQMYPSARRSPGMPQRSSILQADIQLKRDSGSYLETPTKSSGSFVASRKPPQTFRSNYFDNPASDWYNSFREEGSRPVPNSPLNTQKKGVDDHQRGFQTSKVHPSNQCSACSSYTIFFKTRCVVCEKSYCSNCAANFMGTFAEGYKCKDTCSHRSVCRRYRETTGVTCWPFCFSLMARAHDRNVDRKT